MAMTSFGAGTAAFETDSTRMKIVMNLLSLARDFNADLIPEGVEHEPTAEIAASLSIPLGASASRLRSKMGATALSARSRWKCRIN